MHRDKEAEKLAMKVDKIVCSDGNASLCNGTRGQVRLEGAPALVIVDWTRDYLEGEWTGGRVGLGTEIFVVVIGNLVFRREYNDFA